MGLGDVHLMAGVGAVMVPSCVAFFTAPFLGILGPLCSKPWVSPMCALWPVAFGGIDHGPGGGESGDLLLFNAFGCSMLIYTYSA